jgi:hypothetical protein
MPTEETLPPSHGLTFSDIFDADAYHIRSTPPEPEPEELFHEASEYSDDHDSDNL